MTARLWLAGALGAVVMFLWLSIAHMALGLGEAGLKQIPNEAPLLASMQTTLPGHGTYLFPNMDPKDMGGNMRKIEVGPSGMLIYFPMHKFNFGTALVFEFLTELVLILIAVYLLTFTRITTSAGRVGYFALIGFCVASATNVQYLNWYGFDLTYTLASIFTMWVGYILAGAVVGAIKVGGTKQL